MTYAWILDKGEFVPLHQLELSPDDRAWAYGDGVFSTLKVEQQTPLFLEEHLERLQSHAASLGIAFPKILPAQIVTCVPPGDWKMKIILTGGSNTALGLPPKRAGDFVLVFSNLPPNPKSWKVCRYPHVIESPLARIKSLAYLERSMVTQYALDQGCDEALVCNSQGFLLEGGRSNFFWTLDHDFFTPNPDLPLLFGLTLKHEMERHRSQGFKIHYVQLTPEEIPQQAKLFAANSLIGSVRCLLK